MRLAPDRVFPTPHLRSIARSLISPRAFLCAIPRRSHASTPCVPVPQRVCSSAFLRDFPCPKLTRETCHNIENRQPPAGRFRAVNMTELAWFFRVTNDYSDYAASHSFSFDQRRRVCWPRTAIDNALRWPTSTTSRLPRVTAV